LSKETIQFEFPDIFKDLGNIGKYYITLKEYAIPAIHQTRMLLHSLIKQSLDANLKCGVLYEPTDWVHNLAIVEKKNGSLRLCLNLLDLDKVIKENITGYPLHKNYPINLPEEGFFYTRPKRWIMAG